MDEHTWNTDGEITDGGKTEQITPTLDELAETRGYIAMLEAAIKKATTGVDAVSPIEAMTRLMVLQRETGI